LAGLPGGVSAGELAGLLNVPRPTIHRLLNVMLDTRLIEQAAGGYQLSDRVRTLALMGLNEPLLTPILEPILREVAEATRMTVYIGKLEGIRVVSLMMDMPGEHWRGYVLPGRVFPPHAAAGAKAILAYQPEALVREALDDGGMERFTPHTMTEVDDVLADLKQVRKRGFATCIREIDEALFALSVPIFTGPKRAIMSLGVTAPLSRLPPERMPEAAAELSRFADRMALLLRRQPS
jgi:DNA-binding IclR family transcriptional regulator